MHLLKIMPLTDFALNGYRCNQIFISLWHEVFALSFSDGNFLIIYTDYTINNLHQILVLLYVWNRLF